MGAQRMLSRLWFIQVFELGKTGWEKPATQRLND
jgi:hypothetical protein